jgi:hypothetical protein
MDRMHLSEAGGHHEASIFPLRCLLVMRWLQHGNFKSCIQMTLIFNFIKCSLRQAEHWSPPTQQGRPLDTAESEP